MNINLTLIVQAINFFIAYIIITRVLLKPAYTIIAHDKKIQDDLRAHIAQEQAKLAALKLYKTDKWSRCQKDFKAHMPSGISDQEALEFNYLLAPTKKLADKKYFEDLARELAHYIKQKVVHD